MASGSVVLAVYASVPLLLIFGICIGWRLSQRQFAARTKRKAAAQLSVCRQLHELQAARQQGYPVSLNWGNPASGFQRRAA